MKALTILQPWADCICYFGKRVENRTWAPYPAVVGTRIAIHAGKAFDDRGHTATMKNRDIVGPVGVVSHLHWILLASPKRPRGAVVATAIVHGITRSGDSPWFCGPFGWILRDVVVLKDPIPCRGAQLLWGLPADVEKALDAAEVVNGGAGELHRAFLDRMAAIDAKAPALPGCAPEVRP